MSYERSYEGSYENNGYNSLLSLLRHLRGHHTRGETLCVHVRAIFLEFLKSIEENKVENFLLPNLQLR